MILIETAVIILLITTIIFCMKLGRQLYHLKNSKIELAKLFNDFQKKVQNADELIKHLNILINDSANLLNNELNNKIATASGINKEINNMIKKADIVGQDLEQRIVETKQFIMEIDHKITGVKNPRIINEKPIQTQNSVNNISTNNYMTSSKTIREINSPKSIYELGKKLQDESYNPSANSKDREKEKAIIELLRRISAAQDNKENVE